MTTYVIATAEPPTIVCPSWCVVPLADHLADLEQWEGRVIHWSADHLVRHAAETYVNGTLVADEPPLVFVDCHAADGVTLEVAEQLAHDILHAVEEARS